MKNKKAFTLIELLVVIAVISLITSVILVNTRSAREKARIAKLLEFSQTIQNAIGAEAVGIWNFDEGSGTTASDSSGYRNNGTFSSPAPSWTNDTPHQIAGVESGKYALSFDGSTNYVMKNTFNNFPVKEITAEFWMKSSNTTKSGTPISYARSGMDNEFLIYNYGGFYIYIGGVSVSTGISANDGKWHQIVVSWKSSDGSTRFYKDGKLVYSGTLQTGYSIVGGGCLVIGQEQDAVCGGFDAGQAFLGILDEVRIYNLALTQSEIEKHYAEELNKFQIVQK